MPITIPRHSDQVIVGINGGGWTAPLGTVKPATPLDTPAAPWRAMGRITEDGLTYGFSEEKQDFKSWGQTAPFRTVITQSIRTFKVTAQETGNPVVKSLMFRVAEGSLTPDVDGIVEFAETASPTPDRRAFWFVVIDGDTFQGFYVPEGEVSDRADVSYKSDSIAAYELTMTAYPDEAGNTVYHTYKVPLLGESES